jgi:toxin ParE1/3/4
MTKLVVSDAARRDLRDISRYTEQTWGSAQRQIYLEAIERRFALLRERPSVGSPRDEIRSGYRSIPSQRHMIFYKVADDTVEIIRILHANMDFYRHLGPEATEEGE